MKDRPRRGMRAAPATSGTGGQTPCPLWVLQAAIKGSRPAGIAALGARQLHAQVPEAPAGVGVVGLLLCPALLLAIEEAARRPVELGRGREPDRRVHPLLEAVHRAPDL